MTNKNWTRREVLKTGTAAFLLPTLIPASVLGREGIASPSETVRVGVIGCGQRARHLIKEGADVKGFNVVAVCDCYKQTAENFALEMPNGEKWSIYEDFRTMIEKEQLDAVMVETTTHARAWVSIIAMQMGVDVYIEKPMCLTVAEGRTMVNAARRYNTVTQVGTQQRSMPINNWASDLVKNGALGKIKTVLAPNFIGPIRWPHNHEKIESPIDPAWDVWTNQTELRPYSKDLKQGWARWWDYDSGGLCFGVTGWGTHSYDQINRALGTDDTGPTEILLEEEMTVQDSGKFAPRETVGGVVQGITGDIDTGTEYYGLARITGPRAKVRMKFAEGTELRLHLDGDRGPGLGAIFIGENGKLEINRNKIAGNPKELINSSDNPGPNRRPETAYHIENWIECIKTRQRCNADIEIGQRASTLCYLVNIARDIGRVGKPLHWDPISEQFTNCEEANTMLSRPRRKGYELPNIS